MRLHLLHTSMQLPCFPDRAAAVSARTACIFRPAAWPVQSSVLPRRARRAALQDLSKGRVCRRCRCLASCSKAEQASRPRAQLTAAALAFSLLLQPVNALAVDFGGVPSNAVVEVVSGVVSQDAALNRPATQALSLPACLSHERVVALEWGSVTGAERSSGIYRAQPLLPASLHWETLRVLER